MAENYLTKLEITVSEKEYNAMIELMNNESPDPNNLNAFCCNIVRSVFTFPVDELLPENGNVRVKNYKSKKFMITLSKPYIENLKSLRAVKENRLSINEAIKILINIFVAGK